MRRGTLFTPTSQGPVAESFTRWDNARFTMYRGIFISHKKEDSNKAIKIGHEISSKARVPCYVDELDPNFGSDSAELVSYIQEVIYQCRSLLAIVSELTAVSWWVPLEIGIALERKKYIGSYITARAALPSYLWSWPTMTTNGEAVEWARTVARFDSADRLHDAWRNHNERYESNREYIYQDL